MNITLSKVSPNSYDVLNLESDGYKWSTVNQIFRLTPSLNTIMDPLLKYIYAKNLIENGFWTHSSESFSIDLVIVY